MNSDVSTWGRTPFVGRDTEKKVLEEALAVAKQGEARIVSLIGPAGIGKSRLIQDFIQRLRAPDHGPAPRVYRGSARDTATAFGLFAKLLRTRFGLAEGMAKELARDKLKNQVAAVLDDSKVSDVVYFLGQFLGIPGEESLLTRAVSDDPREAEIIRRAVFKAFIEADAAHAPICLVLEDLHHAHDDSITLLRYLLESLSGPILILCAARPELLMRQEEFARGSEARHRVLDLSPLPDQEAMALMRHLLAPCEGGPPEQLVRAACAFASGSPLLLEQMVRICRDKGVLEELNGPYEQPRWRVDLEKLTTVELPQTVEDAVSVRLAALQPYQITLLEQAAAMGSVFWSGAFVPLARMGREAPVLWDDDAADDVEEVHTSLEDLVERDYIIKLPDSTFPGSAEYVFKHSREREAIQRRTRAGAIKRYHHGIADWMEHQVVLRNSEECVAMLAAHREKAGDTLRAGLAYLDAGDVARDRYATSRACGYYEKGLNLLGDQFPGRRIDALHHYGDVLNLSGRIDDALEAFREMLTIAYRLGLKNKGGAAHNRIGRVYRDIGALEDSTRHLQAGLALFKAANDERGVASSIDDIGKLYWMKGEYREAEEALRDGLTRRRALADRRSIALSLNNLGVVLQDSGEFKDAVEVFTQSLEIRRAIGDLVGVVVSLNNLGTLAQDQRDFPNALLAFDEALEVAKEVGDRNKISVILTNLGEVKYRMGQPAEAIAVLKQAEDLCDELGDKLGLAEALRGLGKAHMLHGDLPKARECISRAVDLFASVRSKVHLGMALRTLGEITAAGGWGSAHTKSAREYFARAAAIFEQTGNDVELGRTFKVFSRFLLENDARHDEVARREALGMNTRAEAIFTRLRISQGRVEVPPSRRPRVE